MKKSLLALAVLASFAGAASAQSSVTIYGVADIGLQRVDSNERGVDETWRLSSGNQSGSRIGFRGTEDLGGGLSALFTLEAGYSLDTGTGGSTEGASTLFNRQAFVGLKGGFGTVAMGRQYSPMHLFLDSIDPFATNLSGNVENIFPAGSIINSRNNVDNSITYTTPSFGGVTGQVLYGFGEEAGSTARSRQMGAHVGYVNGPINVGLAYHRANGGVNSSTALPAGTNDLAPGENANSFVLGGTYDFGVAKAHAAFGQHRVELIGDEDEKARTYMLGVSAPVGGAGRVLASWVRGDDRNSDDQIDQYAIGYTHGLSKRTNLYTSFGYTVDKDARSDGRDLKGTDFRVGVRHLF
ncbi:porin [Noviherbaspirillum aridicola]|uniref:Porin n=1 Tax=Noviherbaspirillum aridicola TaxID=2849687 RepID=A0ABQ4Q768_9BURK|nr:porin [Noviherbaspirillum aridicola]GIZ52886.1 porin [Noviherbaspirillum aridicola]